MKKQSKKDNQSPNRDYRKEFEQLKKQVEWEFATRLRWLSVEASQRPFAFTTPNPYDESRKLLVCSN